MRHDEGEGQRFVRTTEDDGGSVRSIGERADRACARCAGCRMSWA